MKTVKRFDVGSVCKIVFIVDLIFIVAVMIPFSVILMVAPHKEGEHPAIAGIIMMVVHPILATLGAAIATAVYNVAAKNLGGIKVEIE